MPVVKVKTQFSDDNDPQIKLAVIGIGGKLSASKKSFETSRTMPPGPCLIEWFIQGSAGNTCTITCWVVGETGVRFVEEVTIPNIPGATVEPGHREINV